MGFQLDEPSFQGFSSWFHYPWLWINGYSTSSDLNAVFVPIVFFRSQRIRVALTDDILVMMDGMGVTNKIWSLVKRPTES